MSVNKTNTVVAAIGSLPATAAKMAAVEILLADPTSLHDDVLESCLYILRERLREPGASDAGGLMTLAGLSARLTEYTDATAESFEALRERVGQLEARAGGTAKPDDYERLALVAAACLTEPQLAEMAGWTVTTIVSAEAGRLWPFRPFWEAVDKALGGDGELLRRYDSSHAGEEPASLPEPAETRGAPAAQAAFLVIWADGSVTTFQSSVDAPEPES
jgi:hypothetical protein